MRNQRRSAVVKPADAPSPNSVPVFQRSAHRAIRYWIWTRFSDARAGFADRDRRKPEDTPLPAQLGDTPPSRASSPWLDRLGAEYLGAVEEEAGRHGRDQRAPLAVLVLSLMTLFLLGAARGFLRLM